MLERNMKDQSLVVQRILTVDIRKKMLPAMKQFWRFAKTAEVEN